jgi:amino acid adenylation domain-containing protein
LTVDSDEVFEFPATPTQRALWFVHRLNPAGSAYNIPIGFRVRGPLDARALRNAFQSLVDRHEIFRTLFGEHEGEMVQRVHSSATVDWRETRIDADGDPAALCRARATLHAREPFDLEAGPLLRVRLERFSDTDALLVMVFHHIVVDHFALGQCARELGTLYASALYALPAPLAKPELQFADYAVWLAEQGNEAERERKLGLWKRRLEGFSGFLDLPVDPPAAASSETEGGEWRYRIGEPLAARAKQFARSERVSLYLVMLSAFKVLLHRYSEQPDIIVGTPFANRGGQEALEQVMGCFINTLPIATDFSAITTFRQLLPSVKATMLEAFDLQDVPLDTIVDAVKPRREPGRNPLFQVGFVLQEPPIGLALEGLSLDDLHTHSGGAMYDLHFWMWETEGGIDGVVWFNTSRYGETGMRRLLDTYQHVLAQLLDTPDAALGGLSLVPEAQALQLRQWNATARDWPAAESVLGMLRAQCARAPRRCAISTSGGQCTYAELEARSDALAQHLADRGAESGALVGLCLERSVEMLVAQLAILKTGAAYVPLDPAYPKDRLNHMATDAHLRLLVTHSGLAGAIAWPRERSVHIDSDAALIAAARPDKLAPIEVRPQDPAYVIYTSGSTGTPKGVVVPHGALANFLHSMAQEPGLTEADRLVAVTTLSFDIAVLELLLPLTVGAEVVLAERDAVIDGQALRALLERSAATVMQATPSTWRMLVDAGWRGTPGFKALIGGEGLPHDLARQLLQRCGQLWNMYGPTETTVWSSCWRVDPAVPGISIGRPIANTQIHLLDTQMRPRPIGVPGEIWIGGDGVTLGYLDRPELSAERFRPDPIDGRPGACLYRTGDRGRWRHDGLLEHLGRLDFQVKVRGHRIELGEIEANLDHHPAVARSVVIVREDAAHDARLVAYIVPRDTLPSAAELRDFLRTALPEYMLPQHIVAIAQVPLLPNGKIDLGALSAVQADANGADEPAFAAPETDTETVLAGIWQLVLRLDRISVDADFFDLGGHSMLATRLMAQIEAALARKLPLSALMEAPTVRKLAAWVDRQAARDSLVLIRSGGARPSLFLIHDGDGETLLYRSLALRLRHGHAVYGLQPLAGDGHAMLHTRIPDMAAYHLAKIRSAQPEGPYLLGGLCAGGVIAFEVARQLEEQGQTIAMLALMDVADVDAPLLSGLLVGRRLNSFRSGVTARGTDTLLGSAATASAKLLNLLRYEGRTRLQALKSRRSVKALRQHLDRHIAPPSELRALSVREVYMFARSQYTVSGALDGQVVLFRATQGQGDLADEPVTEIHPDPMLGWARRVTHEIQTVDVPGGHVSMLQDPHVDTLAKKLQEHIDLALAQITAPARPPASTIPSIFPLQ